jgi:hypothetical protein
MWPAEQPRRNQEIAGCGTSQAASYGLREPDARITAIDISDTSLRHTREIACPLRIGAKRLLQPCRLHRRQLRSGLAAHAGGNGIRRSLARSRIFI